MSLKPEEDTVVINNIIAVFKAVDNKPSLYSELDEIIKADREKYTDAKTSVGIWNKCAKRLLAGTDHSSDDSFCERRGEFHRVCCKSLPHGKGRARVVWIHEKLAKALFTGVTIVDPEKSFKEITSVLPTPSQKKRSVQKRRSRDEGREISKRQRMNSDDTEESSTSPVEQTTPNYFMKNCTPLFDTDLNLFQTQKMPNYTNIFASGLQLHLQQQKQLYIQQLLQQQQTQIQPVQTIPPQQPPVSNTSSSWKELEFFFNNGSPMDDFDDETMAWSSSSSTSTSPLPASIW